MLSPVHQAILRELNDSLQALDDDASVMILCNGKLPGNVAFYAFLDIPAAKLMSFQDAIREGKELRLSEYGEIVRSGEGLEPPLEVRREMETQYNLDYGLGEKLRLLFPT